uniref:UBX domain-containing protein n=1 Tax=Timema shepardi TaxID=629360 RepID=A0A7R9FVV9_TIMSH|nr:unnamed protein product [Timema shepardi]
MNKQRLLIMLSESFESVGCHTIYAGGDTDLLITQTAVGASEQRDVIADDTHVEQCVETLCKYLENILHNPGEEKYHRIRQSNRVFQERVAPLEGTQDLLQAAGFQAEDDYLVSGFKLRTHYSAEPITLELDHNLQVLLPSQAASRRELPPVFYNLTPEEIKREQQNRSEILEKSLMLRTKAMREKEELREMRKYKYALIRVRFPDGILLQGTFSVYEKFEDVTSFLRETLVEEDRPFVLTTPTGHRLGPEEDSQTLVDLRLVPASVLIFSWDPPLVSADKQQLYLKPEIVSGDLFNIEQPTVFRVAKKISILLADNVRHVLKFPTGVAELAAVNSQFYDKANFHGVLGCINCTHIAVLNPGGPNGYISEDFSWRRCGENHVQHSMATGSFVKRGFPQRRGCENHIQYSMVTGSFVERGFFFKDEIGEDFSWRRCGENHVQHSMATGSFVKRGFPQRRGCENHIQYSMVTGSFVERGFFFKDVM